MMASSLFRPMSRQIKFLLSSNYLSIGFSLKCTNVYQTARMKNWSVLGHFLMPCSSDYRSTCKFIIHEIKSGLFFFNILFCSLFLKDAIFPLRKHAYSNKLKILPPKNENVQIKNSDIFHISDQNVDCWYSLEPPRRGSSNEYPQSIF